MGRQMVRVSGWVLGGLVALLTLVVVGVGVYTQTVAFRAWLKGQLVAALQPSIHGELTLERVSGSVWTKIYLHNLSIRQDGKEVLTIPQAALTVHLLPQLYALLWSRSLHITALDVTAPQMTLLQAQDGRWNISHLFDIAEVPQEPALLFDRIRVTEGRVDIRYATGEEARLAALALTGDLALLPTGTQVHLTQVEFSLTHPRIPAVRGTGGLSYDDTVSPPTLRLQDFGLQTAHSQLRIAGMVRDLAEPTAELTLAVGQLAAAEVRAVFPAIPLQEDLSGQVRVTGSLAALHMQATVTAPHGQATGSGVVNLMTTPPQYQGQVTVQRVGLDKVLRIPHFAGEVRGQLAVTGTGLDPTQATVQASASRVLVYGWPVETVELTGELSKNRLTINTTATGTSGSARLQGHITLGRSPQYEVTGNIHNLDIARVVPEQSPVSGQLNFDVWAQGAGLTLEELDGAARVTFRPSRLGPVTITQGEVNGSLRRGQFTVNRLQLRTTDTTFTAQGAIDIHGHTPDGRLAYAVEANNIAPWLALIGYTGAGQLQLTGTANGTVHDLRLEGKAALANLRLATLSVETGVITWTLTGVGGERPHGRVTASLAQLQAGTDLRAVETTLTVTGLRPTEIQATAQAQADESRTLTLETTVRYDGQQVDAQLQNATVQLPTGTWRIPQPAQFRLHDSALTLTNFRLQRGNQAISITGVVSRRGTQNLQAQVQRFPLAELQALLLDDGPEVGGFVSAEVSVRGTAASPVIEANVTTDGLTIAGQSYTGLTAAAAYQQEYLRLSALFRQDATHELTIEGGVPLALGWAEDRVRPVLGAADLRVRSEGLSLAFLGLLSKEVRDVQGTVSLDVHVGGTLDALTPTGEIRVQRGQVRVLPLGTVLRNIEVQLGLLPSGIQVARLSVTAGKGQLTGSGQFTLRRSTITALDFTLNADRFRVVNTPEYTVAVSGQIFGSGSLQSPVVRGALTLRDTTFRPNLSALKSGPVAMDPTVTVVRNVQELASRPQQTDEAQEQDADRFSFPRLQNEGYRQLRLDLAVTIPRDTWVQMHDGSIELTGHLRVRKNPTEDVILSGQIETVRGWYAFYGRQFQIERGQITFTGSSTIDPSLEVIARYTLPRYKVDVVIGGTADAPTLTLRSDPALDQADILSLLAFGKPANALNQGEKVSLQAQVLQATAGYVAADLRQSVAERLGLDSLELDVAEGRFGVGKYVTKDVFVSTSQQLGDQQKQEVSLEYQLDTDWQLKASTTSQGDSSIDLFWHKRY
ncbi:MAG: translocation/assembly module TamB [Thermodesulfobacteriota bacterium]